MYRNKRIVSRIDLSIGQRRLRSRIGSSTCGYSGNNGERVIGRDLAVLTLCRTAIIFDSWELYYDDKNVFYADADFWKDHYCPEEVPGYGADCQRLIDNLITKFFGKSESWESICKLIVKTSDLNNPDSPAIQLFHKMLMLRDDIDQPSYMMRYYFKYFVSEYNDLLTESGYYGSNIKRYSDAEINRLMPKVMPKVI